MNVVILAAGQGKRMHSDIPKVLHRLAGRSLLAHVLAVARELSPHRICVVYGHGGEAVRDAIHDHTLVWVKQSPQLGTGHAVLQALPHLISDAPTLILYGDVPLTRASTLRRLIEAAGDGVVLLTVELEDPTGYGRVVREGDKVRCIVEHKDATPTERALREVNTGIMLLPGRCLERWLNALKNNNAQGEYYLTDLVAFAVAENVSVQTRQPDAAW